MFNKIRKTTMVGSCRANNLYYSTVSRAEVRTGFMRVALEIFLKMVETIAKYDRVLIEHVQRIQKNPDTISHYLGEHFEDEMILWAVGSSRGKVMEPLKF
jgi:hypothetical protein